MTAQKISCRPGKNFFARVYPASVPSKTFEIVTVPVTINELVIQVKMREPLNNWEKLSQEAGEGIKRGGNAMTTEGGWKADTTIQYSGIKVTTANIVRME